MIGRQIGSNEVQSIQQKKNLRKNGEPKKNYRLGCASVKLFPTVNVAAVRVGGDGVTSLTSLHFSTISKRERERERVCVCRRVLLRKERETSRKIEGRQRVCVSVSNFEREREISRLCYDPQLSLGMQQLGLHPFFLFFFKTTLMQQRKIRRRA